MELTNGQGFDGLMQGLGTVFTLIAFLGVCWWAYSKDKKADFDEAALLPFDEDELSSPAFKKHSKQTGEPD